MKSSDFESQLALFVLYAITLLSIIGGWLPTYFVDKKGMNPYAGRMRSMLIFAFFPLLALAAQPLGHISYWYPVIIIGIAGAAHQAWSANLFTTVSDMFPKRVVASLIGIGSTAGSLGGMAFPILTGMILDKYTNGYALIFGFCSVAYLVAFAVNYLLAPKFDPVTFK